MASRAVRLARGFAFLSNAVIAALVLGAAAPGTHRVVCPECYGLSEIAPRVWTDAPGRTSELLGLVEAGRRKVAAFFGDASTPLVVLCTGRRCARDFGIRGNGLSISDLVVIAGPGGITAGTLAHEMTHSRLHRKMGFRNVVAQPYPTWFDEGLASLVANHPRWPGEVTAADRARVRQTVRFWQWDDTFREVGVGRAYAAAAAEVAEIEARAGREGLLELIRRAEAGEEFGRVVREVTGG
jgi:hypothetical protein